MTGYRYKEGEFIVCPTGTIIRVDHITQHYDTGEDELVGWPISADSRNQVIVSAREATLFWLQKGDVLVSPTLQRYVFEYLFWREKGGEIRAQCRKGNGDDKDFPIARLLVYRSGNTREVLIPR